MLFQLVTSGCHTLRLVECRLSSHEFRLPFGHPKDGGLICWDAYRRKETFFWRSELIKKIKLILLNVPFDRHNSRSKGVV